MGIGLVVGFWEEVVEMVLGRLGCWEEGGRMVLGRFGLLSG